MALSLSAAAEQSAFDIAKACVVVTAKSMAMNMWRIGAAL